MTGKTLRERLVEYKTWLEHQEERIKARDSRASTLQDTLDERERIAYMKVSAYMKNTFPELY